jgi:predicted dehydrogenase
VSQVRAAKIGILGAGFVANTFHMPSFREVEGLEVVAAFSHRKEVAEDFARRWNVPKTYYGDEGIAKLCSDPEVELVDIALPNNLHLDATTAAAENHKNVICEKPLARNEQEAKQMLDVVRKHNVLHFYAENQVFIPQIARARSLIERGVLGQIFWVRCREAHFGQHSAWFYDPKLAGGGALLDLGAHAVEVARYLLGKKPVSVFGWASKLAHSTIGEDNALVLLKHKDSELAQAENSWVTRGGLEFHVEVYGGNGRMFVDISREAGISLFTAQGASKISGAGETIMETTETKKGRVFPALNEHATLGFVDEIKHFLSSLSTGQKAIETFEEGYFVNKVIGAAYRSAKSGSWEPIQED